MHTVGNSNCLLGGCLVPGGVWSWGEGEGGAWSQVGGGIPACTEADPPMNRMSDRQVYKHNLRNFVVDGK